MALHHTGRAAPPPAWLLVVTLIVAAAVPLRAVSDGPVPRAPLAARDSGAPVSVTPFVAGAGRTVRLLGLGGPGSDRLLSRIATNIAAAVEKVEAFWGFDWSHDIAVVATGSEWQFRAAAGGGTAGQWDEIAAVAVADRVDPAHRIAVGQRIVFAPGAAAMSEPALRMVLAHELFHYAARADTALDAPRWLTEGVADFVARPHTAVPVAPLPTTLLLDADLDTPGPQRSLAYDRAWWFARFVADTYGAAKLRELYRSACGVGHPDLPTAVRDVLGTNVAEQQA